MYRLVLCALIASMPAAASQVSPCSPAISEAFVAAKDAQVVKCLADQALPASAVVTSNWTNFCATPSCVQLLNMSTTIAAECQPATTNIVPVHFCTLTCQTTLDLFRNRRGRCLKVVNDSTINCDACVDYFAETETLVDICGFWDSASAMRNEDALRSKLLSCKSTLVAIDRQTKTSMFNAIFIVLAIALAVATMFYFGKQIYLVKKQLRAAKGQTLDEKLRTPAAKLQAL
ncbi:hypothetical protein Ae201684P_020097 [Aphanomyces euteiches]|uniref:Folate receptor-like domain-containing protein n=1 Tax=Aphanomyces euteiches TaxID=100861 RepID=A0A6G0W7Q6_9STRA|nr:hypothetical protein Ae201684_018629 [Aphanomyces euteiches]KAH9071838.1 hypothetical protein Ae201684P_020097 [Aphanomyces euteiches]KAH9138219.1 hypothetical protein AeRB84_017434 [Aphanomyces euteiches]